MKKERDKGRERERMRGEWTANRGSEKWERSGGDSKKNQKVGFGGQKSSPTVKKTTGRHIQKGKIIHTVTEGWNWPFTVDLVKKTTDWGQNRPFTIKKKTVKLCIFLVYLNNLLLKICTRLKVYGPSQTYIFLFFSFFFTFKKKDHIWKVVRRPFSIIVKRILYWL